MDRHLEPYSSAPVRRTMERRTWDEAPVKGGARAATNDRPARVLPGYQPGRLLPTLELPHATRHGTIRLRAGRGPRAVIALHGLDCDRCRAYAERLATHAQDAAAEQGGRFMVVLPGRVRDERFASWLTDRAIVVLDDTDHRIATGAAFVIVADEWGEIYSFREADDAHELPDPGEIIDWLRFIAIQCPECGEPEGEWHNI